MPAIRTLTPATGADFGRTWTDPKDGTTVSAVLEDPSIVPIALSYGATLLTCDAATSYQDSIGQWVRSWRAVGVTVVTTGDGYEMTGKVFP